MATLEEEIDQLRTSVEQGFAQTVKKEDLAKYATKEDLAQFATKEDLALFATKEDLDEAMRSVAEGLLGVQDNMTKLRGDMAIMLDKQMGEFHKYFDSLAGRIKVLESKVA